MGLSTASAVDQRIITKIMFNYEKKSQYRFRSRPEDPFSEQKQLNHNVSVPLPQ